MADSYQNDYIQHPLLYELSHKYRQQLNEYVPEATITFKLEELKEHIRKEMRKELKIKEGAEKLRGVSTDKKTLSDVASIVKKSNLKLNEMQADLQELESQIILTHGQSTQPGTPNCNNSHSDLNYAVTPIMGRYSSMGNDKNSAHEMPVHQSNFSTDFKILSLEKQLNIELKVKQGAENMIQSLTSSHSRDKKLLAEAQQMLADSKAKIEYLKMRIMKAKQNKEQMASNGDIPNNNNNKDKFERNLEPLLEDRIEELRHRLRIELAVYEGAKNVIRSFQNAKYADKKTLHESRGHVSRLSAFLNTKDRQQSATSECSETSSDLSKDTTRLTCSKCGSGGSFRSNFSATSDSYSSYSSSYPSSCSSYFPFFLDQSSSNCSSACCECSSDSATSTFGSFENRRTEKDDSSESDNETCSSEMGWSFGSFCDVKKNMESKEKKGISPFGTNAMRKMDVLEKFGSIVSSLRKPGHHVGPSKNADCLCDNCRSFFCKK